MKWHGRRGLAVTGRVRHGKAGKDRRGAEWHGTTRHGRHGVVGSVLARRGTAGVERLGRHWHGTADSDGMIAELNRLCGGLDSWSPRITKRTRANNRCQHGFIDQGEGLCWVCDPSVKRQTRTAQLNARKRTEGDEG